MKTPTLDDCRAALQRADWPTEDARTVEGWLSVLRAFPGLEDADFDDDLDRAAILTLERAVAAGLGDETV